MDNRNYGWWGFGLLIIFVIAIQITRAFNFGSFEDDYRRGTIRHFPTSRLHSAVVELRERGQERKTERERVESSSRQDSSTTNSSNRNKATYRVEVRGKFNANEKASYAYELSEGDKDFVLLLNAENQSWDFKSRHKKGYILCWTWGSFSKGILPNQKACKDNSDNFWRTSYDYGLCGISDGYYKSIVEDERFLTNWKWQIGECLKLYKKGVRFYGWNVRHKRGSYVIFK